MTRHLLAAADRFDLGRLKSICAEKLRTHWQEHGCYYSAAGSAASLSRAQGRMLRFPCSQSQSSSQERGIWELLWATHGPRLPPKGIHLSVLSIERARLVPANIAVQYNWQCHIHRDVNSNLVQR
jgi:hypothetical protein